MATVAAPKIVAVAQQIVDDIRRRKLGPGDPYLNTAETAQMLRVSGSTVNRALQLLAQRGVIRRRQRQGTLITGETMQAALRRVHIVIREDHLRTEGLWADGVLFGLQSALPGTDLQFNFRPQVDDADYVRRLIDDVLRARESAGFVLIRAGVTVQRLVAASGLPAVVSGTLQPSVTELPSVERDQRQIGVLLAEHLLETGCRRFLLLMRDRITAGDHVLLDGARQTLAAAGIKLDDVVLRCLPTDDDAIESEVRNHLASVGVRVGCLCRSEPLARGVATAAKSLKLPVKRRPAIAVADVARSADAPSEFACVETVVSPSEYGAELGRVLAACAAGTRPEPYRKIIPVRLHLPQSRRSRPAARS
ncbi:MAG: GntR family transcriptional regulator [Pirellulales bacterium]